eukprot:SAG22_NODE_975_length_6203_cov_25.423001_4_plen_132_part_00
MLSAAVGHPSLTTSSAIETATVLLTAVAAEHLSEAQREQSVWQLFRWMVSLQFLGEIARPVAKMLLVLLAGSLFYFVDASANAPGRTISYVDCLYFGAAAALGLPSFRLSVSSPPFFSCSPHSVGPLVACL